MSGGGGAPQGWLWSEPPGPKPNVAPSGARPSLSVSQTAPRTPDQPSGTSNVKRMGTSARVGPPVETYRPGVSGPSSISGGVSAAVGAVVGVATAVGLGVGVV